MKKVFNNVLSPFLIAVLLFLSGISIPVGVLDLQQACGADFDENEKMITMDFDQVDIGVFIKFISELTGRNFVIDTKVRGKVTVLSPTKISVGEAYKVFESVLEVHGYTAVPSGDVTKIVPSVNARQKNIETRSGTRPFTKPGDSFVTQIIPLAHASADEVRKILIPMVSKEGILVSYNPSQTLILTDYQSNVQRIMKIVHELDINQGQARVTVIRLEYASAEKTAEKMTKLMSSPQKKGVSTSAKIKIVPDDRLNALIILAGQGETDQMLKLIHRLDKPTPKDMSSIQVIHLENALAENLAKVLNGLPSNSDPKAKGQAVISKSVKIVADKDSNCIVVTAKPEEFEAISKIVVELDKPREQVYIETSILEVSVSNSLNLGVQWQGGANTGTGDTESLLFGTSNGLIGTSLDDLTTKLASNPSGLSFGVLSFPFMYEGEKFFNIGAFLHAARSDDDVNIISTPQLMTLENTDAKVIIGENRAFTTRLDTTTDNTAYSNYEYKDVGVTLKVTPHINNRGFVKLIIYQEVSRVSGNSMEGTITPVTKRRVAETTVEVKDGETVVIAGLIENMSESNVSGIPLLMDIPGLGWLFKTQGDKLIKQNLLVFLTPHVVRDDGEARTIFYDKMRYIEELRYNADGRAMPVEKGFFFASPLIAE